MPCTPDIKPMQSASQPNGLAAYRRKTVPPNNRPTWAVRRSPNFTTALPMITAWQITIEIPVMVSETPTMIEFHPYWACEKKDQEAG